MSEIQKEQIKKIVYTFAKLANVNDENICNDLINRLSVMNEEDVIDYLVVALSDLVEKGQVKADDIFSNIGLITSLSEKYSSKDDLMTRLNWLKSTGIPNAKSYFTSGNAIVILMGVNDLSNSNNYVSYINDNAGEWKKNGCSLYFVSVNPCDGSYSNLNSSIASFNTTVKRGLNSTVGWIDTNSNLSFNTTDGLHYDSNTSNSIYNYIKGKV